MAIQYRKLDGEDLAEFIQIRIKQLQEEGAEPIFDLEPYLRNYYKTHLKDNTFVSWLAVEGAIIVGTSGMSIVEKPPYYGCPSGKVGLLSSMYTLKDYRRGGIAKILLQKAIQEAKEKGCGTVQITASDMGVLLYKDFGFKKSDNFMYYML